MKFQVMAIATTYRQKQERQAY